MRSWWCGLRMPMKWESSRESEVVVGVEVVNGRLDHEPAWLLCVRLCVCVWVLCAVRRSGRSVVCLRRHAHAKEGERAGCRACVCKGRAVSCAVMVLESYSLAAATLWLLERDLLPRHDCRH